MQTWSITRFNSLPCLEIYHSCIYNKFFFNINQGKENYYPNNSHIRTCALNDSFFFICPYMWIVRVYFKFAREIYIQLNWIDLFFNLNAGSPRRPCIEVWWVIRKADGAFTIIDPPPTKMAAHFQNQILPDIIGSSDFLRSFQVIKHPSSSRWSRWSRWSGW